MKNRKENMEARTEKRWTGYGGAEEVMNTSPIVSFASAKR